ncbi:U3 small nucleolar ribonucleoprotein protein MPP10 [Galdieria sulphuraria]|nr:U3 small nucleolar ribonucleoprotein protein MPP10 [Galdieria sulphuraria]
MTRKPWASVNLPSAVDIVERKPETRECWKELLKTLFERQSKKPYRSQLLGPLSQLYVQGFEVEQLWEQLQLRNRPLLRFVVKKLQQLELQKKETIKEDEQTRNTRQKEETLDEMDVMEDDLVSDEGTQDIEKVKELNDAQLSKQEVDNDEEDKFFSYDAMAKAADRDEPYDEEDNMNDEEEDLWQEELYNETGGETEEQEYHYEKFFDHSTALDTSNKNKNSNSVDPLEERIKQLEEKQIGNKHWSMLGEVRASQRPVNSALDIEIDFDSAMRRTKTDSNDGEDDAMNTLEERIKHRIAESAYDDVIRIKPPETSKPTVLELSQEKDRRGLSEVYEEEYLLHTQGSQVKKQDKRHDEIDQLFQELTTKLDALSNFHYTPRPAPPELKVIPSNLPSIVAEEAVPEVLGDGELLAPEQIYKPSSNQDSENAKQMTSQDRKRWRRKRKRAGRRAKLRKQWEAKVAYQDHGASMKQQRKDAMKTLETLKHATNRIQIYNKTGNNKIGEKIQNKKKEQKMVGHKLQSSSLKL